MVNLVGLLLILIVTFVLFAVLGFVFRSLKWLISIGIVVVIVLLIVGLLGRLPV